ncbi:MAG: hypothetical protein ACYC26_04180 [Phycisphaerales bacterium]
MIFSKGLATTWAAMVLAVVCCATGGVRGQANVPATAPPPARDGQVAKPMSDAQVRDLIGQYVRGDAAAKAGVLEKLSDNPSDVMSSQADVRRFARLILGEARKAGPHPSPIPMDETGGLPSSVQKELAKFSKPLVATFQTPGGEMRVIVSDVSRRNHISGSSPLLVLLHPGFGTPGGKLNQQEWVFAQRRAGVFTCVGMTVLPRCMNDISRPVWSDDKEYRAVSAVLDELSRCYDVDCDRIYLIGNGSGAWGAWPLGGIEGDRFAAVVDIAGACPLKSADQFANFRNVDVGVFVGQDDVIETGLGSVRAARDALLKLQKEAGERDVLRTLGKNGDERNAYRLYYNEYPGWPFGLAMDDKRVGKIIDPWLKHLQRDPYPRIVVWNPVVDWKTRFYNIGVAKPRKGMKIRAQMKEDNTVIVTSSDVPELTVYLNDQLADMKKPVKVIWNDQPAVEVQPESRLSVMLRTLTEHYDEGMFYTFKVELRGKP